MSRIYFNPNQDDHPNEVIGDSTLERTKEIHDFKFTILKSYDHQYVNDDHHNSTTRSSSPAKCESPKMRLYQKFMKSNDNNQTMEDDQNLKQGGSPRESCGENSTNNNNNNNSFVMVKTCSDCSTTKTPLWRSGPHGPKSLCNACGIRQRKARRAAMAASDTPCATNSYNTSNSTTTTLNNPLHHTQIVVPKMKKRSKNPLFSPNIIDHHQTKKICFREFARNLSNNNLSLHQFFPHDEKEAAILLMALSCGFVEG